MTEPTSALQKKEIDGYEGYSLRYYVNLFFWVAIILWIPFYFIMWLAHMR